MYPVVFASPDGWSSNKNIVFFGIQLLSAARIFYTFGLRNRFVHTINSLWMSALGVVSLALNLRALGHWSWAKRYFRGS